MRDEVDKDEGGGVRDESEKDPSFPVSIPAEGKPRQDLRNRLKVYALRVLKLYDALPKRGAVHIITHQLARSGTSPLAHYREACRAKSNADFISKIEGGLQELDESDGWLELLVDGKYVPAKKLESLRAETNELISIFVTMVVNTKKRGKR
ncbi:MAG: four helix bundle protein [Acidobacteria bacterium]|nr:four helix bundle protein [Acidobacteriota bacterium]